MIYFDFRLVAPLVKYLLLFLSVNFVKGGFKRHTQFLVQERRSLVLKFKQLA